MKYKKWSFRKARNYPSEELGIVETCCKYSVSTGTLYS
jgi:putative transposase